MVGLGSWNLSALCFLTVALVQQEGSPEENAEATRNSDRESMIVDSVVISLRGVAPCSRGYDRLFGPDDLGSHEIRRGCEMQLIQRRNFKSLGLGRESRS